MRSALCSDCEAAAREPEFAPGQIYRSLTLRDHRVKLIRQGSEAGVWIVEPAGSSSHGQYTAFERFLGRDDLFELE